ESREERIGVPTSESGPRFLVPPSISLGAGPSHEERKEERRREWRPRISRKYGGRVDWRSMTSAPRKLPSLLLPLVTAQVGAAQSLPPPAAERTNYQTTSTDADVGAFLDSLALAGAPIAISEMGTSTLGHPIYLVIASDPAITSPGQAAAAGKLVVYI